MSQEPREGDNSPQSPVNHDAKQPQLDLYQRINDFGDLLERETKQKHLRDKLGDEMEKCRASERESPSEIEGDYHDRMKQLQQAKEKAETRSHELRLERAGKIGDTAKELVASSDFKTRFNPYERYILSKSSNLLDKKQPLDVYDIALNILQLTIRGEHLTEREAVELALELQKREYREKSRRYGEHFPDDPFSELLYAIENCPPFVYGDSGIRDNLIRRVVALKADAILELCHAKIPSEFTINRAFIRHMIQSCASGAYPEWSGDRFLNKIKSHSDKPYSDEEFETKAPILRAQAEEVARNLVEAVPSIIAVGLTGSLGRPNFFGFNPHSSDIDLWIYNHGWPYEIRQINNYIRPLVEAGIPICLGAAIDDGMGNSQPPWVRTTPEKIEEWLSLASSPDSPFFDMSAFLASAHHEVIILHIGNQRIYNEGIDKPLTDFYRTQVVSLQEQTAQLFMQLDG